MDLRERIASLMGQVRLELAELVAIRSVADPRQFPPEECARAARWVLDAFARVGFSDARLAEMADGSHAVLGTRPGPDPGAPTVLLYAHYDVQPPLNEAEWRTPPFELTEVDGRWYGRGAADCKGNILMHLTALGALAFDAAAGGPGVGCCRPPVLGSAAAITPRASARLNLRVPPGMQAGDAAQALVSHLHAVAPWGVHVKAGIEAPGSGFQARTGGPAYQAIAAAMHEAYGRLMVTLGEGGAIPLCNVLAGTYPAVELI